MFDVFGSVKSLLKLDSVCIDNHVFRLHYKATVIILVVFSLLVSARQYIGDPINCIVNDIPSNVMDTYCWIYSTYTIITPNQVGDRIGESVIQPGVSSSVNVDGEDEVRFHRYYQWIPIVLFFQGMCFYLPRYLWKTWEAGRLKMLALDLISPVIGLDDRKKKYRIQVIVDYFQNNLHCQNFYAIRFIICEVLNFINVIAQIYFIDYILEGEFSTYGWDVLKFTELEPQKRYDPMARVFPKMTKCTFHKYGPSGTIQKFDGLCVLPLNTVNEKIYVFLWFWFILLTILTGLCMIFRSAMIISPTLRLYLLKARSRLSSHKDVQIIADTFQLSDWFILYQLGKNIEPFLFKELLSLLAYKLRKESV